MKRELFNASFRVRNKRLQQSEYTYFECLSYFKASIIIFLLLSAIVAVLLLFSLANTKICLDVEIILTIPILIFGVLSKICKRRIDYVNQQLPW